MESDFGSAGYPIGDASRLQHEAHIVISDVDRRLIVAAAAVQGLIARDGLPHSGDELVCLAVKFADALLAKLDESGVNHVG